MVQTVLAVPLWKTSEDLLIYKIIYSGVFGSSKTARNYFKTKARPAGLEPATLCLEDRFQRFC